MNDIENRLLGTRDALVEKRRGLYETLSAVRGQIVDIEKQISDCAAAARVFGIELSKADGEAVFPRGTIRELAQAMLIKSPAGLEAGQLRSAAEKTFNRQFHYKSAGVALYRLANEGLAMRNGRLWFATPSLSQDKGG